MVFLGSTGAGHADGPDFRLQPGGGRRLPNAISKAGWPLAEEKGRFVAGAVRATQPASRRGSLRLNRAFRQLRLQPPHAVAYALGLLAGLLVRPFP